MEDVEVLTGEQPELPISLDQAVAKLNASWRKQSVEMLQFAKLCKVTRDALPKEQRAALTKRVDMGRAVFNKLCAIADTPFLYDPEVQNKIPAGYSLAWECRKIKEEDFRTAINSGAIHPKVTRKQIQALLPPKPGKAGKGVKYPLLKINVDWSMPEYRKSSFEEWLREGQDEFRGIRINWDDLDKRKNAERTTAEHEAPNEKISVAPEFDPGTILDYASPEEEKV
jgi:hypothetical protein